MRLNFKNSLLPLFFLISFLAQAQNGLNFQGVARNSNNVIIASQQITLRLSILRLSATGTNEYSETKKVTTNAQGLFTVVIGDTGAISSLGNFTSIDWKLGPKFLKIEMDQTAGNNFILIGTTQLQSVAYAQFANEVDAEKINGIVQVEKGGTGVASMTALKFKLGIDKINNTADLDKPISTLTQTSLEVKLNKVDTSLLLQKIDTLYLSNRINQKENIANKSTDTDLGGANPSDILFPTQKAVKDYIAANTAYDLTNGLNTKVDKETGKGLSTNDYTTAEKTKLEVITGTNTGDQDLSNYLTNASITSKENVANKSSATDLGSSAASDILFPSQKAVKFYVDAQINSGGIQDGGILTRHLSDGAVSGAKLSNVISGYKKFYDGAGKAITASSSTNDVLIPAGNILTGGILVWQSFTSVQSGKLGTVEFEIGNPSSIGGGASVYVEIYSGQGVSGNYLGRSTDLSISGFGRSWKTFDLSAANIEFVSGSVYTAKLIPNSSDQDWVVGGNFGYNNGISNISSNWDHNLKVDIIAITNDPFLTETAATALYGSLISNATHTGDVTGATILTITDGVVTTSKFADGAVTSAKISNSAVDLTTKVTGFLPTANIADGAVTSAKISNSAVDLTSKVIGVLPTSNGGTGTITATANSIFAAPDGTDGTPVFRGLVASDLPILTSSYIANNVSTPQAANLNIAGDAVIGGTISASSGIFSNTSTTGSSIVGTLSSTQDITVNGKIIGSGAGNKITNAVFGKDALISNTTGEWNVAIGLETLKNNINGSNNTAIGKFSLHDNISGSNNTAIGEGSMYKNTIGVNNFANGYLTLFSNTSGSFNIVNGTNALVYNTTGSNNIAYGVFAMYNSISGHQNIAIGNMTLNDNISGSNNIAIGKESFKNNTTGSNNTAIGALTNVSSGTLSNSTAIGYGAIVDESNKIQLGNTNVLKVNTSGVFTAASIQNTPIGSTTTSTGAFTSLTSSSDASVGGTLSVTGVTTFTAAPVLLSSTASKALFTNSNKEIVSNNLTGSGNVVMSAAPTLTGTVTLETLTSSSDITINEKKLGKGAGNNSTSTVFGLNALVNNTDGFNNNAIGDLALQKNTIGNNNTAIGYNALNSNTSGSSNIANGNSALLSNTIGSNNIANGMGALEKNISGNSNIANGTNVLVNNLTGSNNIANGYLALYSNTSGSGNIANGYTALYTNSTGNHNFASGEGALKQNNADYNIAIGKGSLYNNTSGFHNIAYGYDALNINTTGNSNIALGDRSLLMNQDGVYNIAIGSQSLIQSTGNENIAIGVGAGSSYLPRLITGSNNIIIGTYAIGSSSSVSNEITLGNSSISTIRSATQVITSLSDRRDKTDIVTIAEGIDFIKQLKPVTFTWNTRDKAKVGIKSAGFIAQDLLALQKSSKIGANLDLVSENNPEKLEARYNNLLPVMVKAIQDQQNIIEDQKKRLDALEKLVNELLKKQ